MLDWSINWGYIYNDFIANLFLICLYNFKFDVNSEEFVFEDREP